LEGGPFTFCVGDGNADMIMDGAITLSGNSGGNSQWVVTDDQGNILGLPPTYSVVDFDDAGSGTCLVWHLSFEDGLTGAEVGLNAADLQGCFSLSNSIEVFRNSPVGGTLEGGPFTFCVGDGDPDQIFDGDISLSGNSGGNSAWVVTDALGEILGLPANYTDVNFDDAPEGICLVWHLSFEDGLIGAEVGLNAADLQGCFSLSDSIVVNRVTDGALCITSVNDKAISNVNLYPNPANGLVRLTADFESIQSTVTIEIYQATGRLIHSATLSNRNSVNEVIDLAHFASGVYMINIISDKAVSNLKLIKE
ncbi:MAG: T9SS type A sorting domain-containing protein, partial [Bacteroidia bacterium]